MSPTGPGRVRTLVPADWGVPTRASPPGGGRRYGCQQERIPEAPMTTKTTTATVPAHALEHAEAPGHMLTTTAARALAVLRIATGFVFLWAFLDKTFGL